MNLFDSNNILLYLESPQSGSSIGSEVSNELEERINRYLDDQGVFSEEPSSFKKSKFTQSNKPTKKSMFIMSSPLYKRRKEKLPTQ